jgi:predicted lysophospholipase L1 biosynthesis ABC-type transport system permease subunit
MPSAALKLLSPEEEIRYMRDVLKIEQPAALVDRLISNYMVLQVRSSMLMSLITLCLTISGFSGHRIASAGPIAATFLSLGLALAVCSAILLMRGPLKLRWTTRHACPEGLDATLISLIDVRDKRTQSYHRAATVLVIGLSCYTISVILFVFTTGVQG